MAGKNGGKRLGAGRPKGTTGIPKASTINKAEARDAHRRVIEKFALRMIRLQVAAAIGIGHVYSRDQHGKFTRIENESVAHQLLTEGTEGKDYWIFMKDPSTAAFTDLMNRAFDKPKEQEQDITLTHDGSLVIRIEKPWRSRSSGTSISSRSAASRFASRRPLPAAWWVEHGSAGA